MQRKSGSGVRVIRWLERPRNVLARGQRTFGLPVRSNIISTIVLLFILFPISMQKDPVWVLELEMERNIEYKKKTAVLCWALTTVGLLHACIFSCSLGRLASNGYRLSLHRWLDWHGILHEGRILVNDFPHDLSPHPPSPARKPMESAELSILLRVSGWDNLMWLAEQTSCRYIWWQNVEVADLIFQLARGKYFYIYLQYLCI
jgi:hypothetical protein